MVQGFEPERHETRGRGVACKAEQARAPGRKHPSAAEACTGRRASGTKDRASWACVNNVPSAGAAPSPVCLPRRPPLPPARRCQHTRNHSTQTLAGTERKSQKKAKKRKRRRRRKQAGSRGPAPVTTTTRCLPPPPLFTSTSSCPPALPLGRPAGAAPAPRAGGPGMRPGVWAVACWEGAGAGAALALRLERSRHGCGQA